MMFRQSLTFTVRQDVTGTVVQNVEANRSAPNLPPELAAILFGSRQSRTSNANSSSSDAQTGSLGANARSGGDASRQLQSRSRSPRTGASSSDSGDATSVHTSDSTGATNAGTSDDTNSTSEQGHASAETDQANYAMPGIEPVTLPQLQQILSSIIQNARPVSAVSARVSSSDNPNRDASARNASNPTPSGERGACRRAQAEAAQRPASSSDSTSSESTSSTASMPSTFDVTSAIGADIARFAEEMGNAGAGGGQPVYVQVEVRPGPAARDPNPLSGIPMTPEGSPNMPPIGLLFQSLAATQASQLKPASSHQLDVLLDAEARTFAITAGEEVPKCPICQEQFVSGELTVQMPCCGNQHHRHCVLRWLGQESGKCPVCRKPLPDAPATPADLSENSIAELKRRCNERNLDCSDCLEKRELVALLLQEREKQQSSSNRARTPQLRRFRGRLPWPVGEGLRPNFPFGRLPPSAPATRLDSEDAASLTQAQVERAFEAVRSEFAALQASAAQARAERESEDLFVPPPGAGNEAAHEVGIDAARLAAFADGAAAGAREAAAALGSEAVPELPDLSVVDRLFEEFQSTLGQAQELMAGSERLAMALDEATSAHGGHEVAPIGHPGTANHQSPGTDSNQANPQASSSSSSGVATSSSLESADGSSPRARASKRPGSSPSHPAVRRRITGKQPPPN